MVQRTWYRIHTLVILALVFFIYSHLSYAQSLLSVGLEYDEKGKPVYIVINGKVALPNEVFLGISIYPEGIKDALTEGKHDYKTVKPNKSFTEKIPLNQIVSGSYEVSLWERKVPKNLAEDKENYFVKIWGFHLDGQLSYTYGYITALK